MSGAPRGPTGEAPLPPADLASRDLLLLQIAAGKPLYRAHRSHHGAVFFGPGIGKDPANRFDSNSGRFGVLYLAPGPDAAMIETILRNPQRLTIDYSEIKTRSLSTLHPNRTLRVVPALGENLSRLGTTAALATGPYDPCGAWSDALFDHPLRPDGILYASRHNPDELCLAIFERDDFAFATSDTTPLTAMLPQVGALLDRHGKSLFGAT